TTSAGARSWGYSRSDTEARAIGSTGSPSGSGICSGRVVGVDAHVAVGEVAAVDGEGAFADAQADADLDLVARQVLAQPGQLAVALEVRVHLLGAEPDHHPLGVDVGVVAALADGHGDTTPVGVGSVHRRLDQGRVHHHLGDPLGLRVVARAVDPDLDQRRRAL